jgi:hypothetical protein
VLRSCCTAAAAQFALAGELLLLAFGFSNWPSSSSGASSLIALISQLGSQLRLRLLRLRLRYLRSALCADRCSELCSLLPAACCALLATCHDIPTGTGVWSFF